MDAFKSERPWWDFRNSVVLQAWAFSPSTINAVDELRSGFLSGDLAAAVESRSIRCVHGHVGMAARQCGHALTVDLAVCADCDSQRSAGGSTLVRADFAVDPIWCIPGDGVDQVVVLN